MAETKLIRDHHLLTRNLRLNGNYISNDGDNEGISITNAGAVAISGTIELGHATDTTLARSGSGDVTIEGNAIYRAGGTDVAILDGGTGASSLNNLITLGDHTTGNYVATLTAGALIDLQNNSGETASPTVDVDLSELTDGTADVVGSADELVYLDDGSQKRKQIDEIKLGQFNNDQSWTSVTNHVTNDADDTMAGTLTIDKDNTATDTGTTKGLFIDYDSTGNATTGQEITNITLDIDLNSDASTNNGDSTIFDTGIDIDIVGGLDGTNNIATGIDINVSGSDSNLGMIITNTSPGVSGGHLKLAYDDGGYAMFTIADNGVTTISTTDSLSSNDANFILDVDGDIEFNADGGDFTWKDDSLQLATLDGSGNFLVGGTLATKGNTQTIGTAGNTNATAYTAVLNTGETAGKNLTLSAGSTVTAGYNLNGGDLILASGGGDGTGTSSIQFQTKVSGTDAAAERMRIHTDGKVGIGVADPDSFLEIFGTSTQLKLSYNADDYATFTVADTGDLTIATVGDGSLDSDLTLDADGDIKLEPVAGKVILLDGTISVDAGVVTGATSITSTAFVGDLTGDASGTAGIATAVTVADESSDATCFPLFVTAATGDLSPKSGSNLTFNSSTGVLTATELGGTALTITGDSTLASIATTGNCVEIDATALTTGSALVLDVNDILTASAEKVLHYIDYDKSGVTAASQTSKTTGLHVDMADAATNHASGTVYMIGAQIDIDSANAQGTLVNQGIVLKIAADDVGDAAGNWGIDMEVMDGGTDLIMRSSADTADYCSISTTASGATTIATVDSDNAEAAHLTFDIQGDTIFKGDIADGTSTEVARIDSSASSLLIASSKKIELGAAEEYIYGDGTDIHFGVGSGGDINIPSNIGLTFADDGEKIESNGTHLTISSGNSVRFNATGEIDFGSTTASFTRQTGTDAVSIDWGEGNKYDLLLENNSTVTFATNPNGACNLLLKVAQGNGGSKIITWAVTSGAIYWAGGGKNDTSKPTLTTTDDDSDILSFYFDGTNYFGVASLGFATSS